MTAARHSTGQLVGQCMDLSGRTAIVTGGSGAIGSSLCETLLFHGANVVSIDKNYGEVTHPGSENSLQVAADVANQEELSQAFQCAIDRFGQIDIVVANAGILSTSRLEDVGVSEWDESFSVNVRGTMLTCQSAAKHLTRGGKIITIASAAGLFGSSRTGVAYSVSKAAVIHLTKVSACQLKPRGISVNCIAPAAVASPMSGAFGESYLSDVASRSLSGDIASPQDVADALLYLASNLARNVTGQVLLVDGGSSPN